MVRVQTWKFECRNFPFVPSMTELKMKAGPFATKGSSKKRERNVPNLSFHEGEETKAADYFFLCIHTLPMALVVAFSCSLS